MKADGIPDGVICVMDMQTNRPVPRPPPTPDENQELFIVIDGDVVPYRKKTLQELVDEAMAMMTDAIASMEAALDVMGQINE